MSKYFTVVVGSYGSYLILNSSKKKVGNIIFVENLSEENSRQKVNNELKKNSNVPIYIVLDNIGQTYNKKKIIGTNIFDAKKIVERKFNYEIPKDDLKEKRFLGKDKDKKEWIFMFISSPIDDMLQDWINIIETNTNILQGIYMLPLEVENMLKKIKTLNTKNKKKNTRWNIMLFDNKVSGFREITFLDDILLFTRVLNIETKDDESVLRELINNITKTIEYLKRFASDFKVENLTITIVVGETKKKLIQGITSSDMNIQLYSVKEFGKIFKSTLEQQYIGEYCDVMLQNIIMNSKKVLSFSNKEMQSVKLFSECLRYINFIKNTFVVVFAIVCVVITFLLVQNQTKLQSKMKQYKNTQEKFEQKKAKKFGNNAGDLDNIIDITSFYTNIKTAKINPFKKLLKDFSTTVADIYTVNNFNWNIKGFSKINFNPNYKSIFIMDGNLINKSGKIDDLFKIYETFDKNLKTKFNRYVIKIPPLPKNINFNTNYYTFPLRIEMSEN